MNTTIPLKAITDQLREDVDAILPRVATARFGAKYTLPPGLFGTIRQHLYANPFTGEGAVMSSVRDIELFFDRPMGEGTYLQPVRYNMLKAGSPNSSTASANQLLFRAPQPAIVKKGWCCVNIPSQTRSISSLGQTSPLPPKSADADGNMFYGKGIVKLAPGVKRLFIPALYLVQEFIYHSKRPKSARDMAGGGDGLYRSPRSLAGARITANPWIAPKAYMRFAASQYFPPQGTINAPGYVRGQYLQGLPSAITLLSHRYGTPGGHAVWTLDLMER